MTVTGDRVFAQNNETYNELALLILAMRRNTAEVLRQGKPTHPHRTRQDLVSTRKVWLEFG